MRFRNASRDEPEINLIPFIDVLLVVLIFLMLSTTYNKFTELQVTLPIADVEKMRNYSKEIIVAISSDGRYSVNKQAVQGRGIDALGAALVEGAKAEKDSVVVISADASTTHQSVVTVMEAARQRGLNQITFATQATSGAGQALR